MKSGATMAVLFGLGLVACGHGAGSGAADPLAQGATSPAGWEEIVPSGVAGRDSPTAGEDAAIAYDPARHQLLLYGGKGDDDVNVNELWSFDLGTRRWERVLSDGPQPPPREDHTLVVDLSNDQLVLYGGEDGDTSHDTWTFDLARRRWQDVTSPSAPALESHVAIYDPRARRMVVFGGMREKGGHDKELEEETWALDLRRGTPGYESWSVLDAHGKRPGARREHDGAYDERRHRLLIFGGRQRSNTSFLNDTWALDLATDTWQEIETHGERPNPVRQMALGYDPAANELTVFGGSVLTYMAGREKDRKEFPVNEIWVLALDTGTWTERTPYPPSVYDHAGIFVPEYGTTLIYGGSGLHTHKEHATWLIREREAAPAPLPALR